MVQGAKENNLQGINVKIPHQKMTVVTGVSGSGKSSLVFDTILAESQRKFFQTLNLYSRQFVELATRPKVDSIYGLLPAIGLAQNETLPSRRATIASQSNLGELFAILFARCGERYCPEHDKLTDGIDSEQLVLKVAEQFVAKFIVIGIEISRQRVGGHNATLKTLSKKGYRKILVDGLLFEIDDTSWVDGAKHDVFCCIDFIKVGDRLSGRLSRSIAAALSEGGGRFSVLPFDLQEKKSCGPRSEFSTRRGCPDCGFSYGKLDSRHFSSGSLGKCRNCDGYGFLDKELTLKCDACLGVGVGSPYTSIRLQGYSYGMIMNLPIFRLQELVCSWLEGAFCGNEVFRAIYDEAKVSIDSLVSIGVGYLSLSRRILSLSGGELQRVRLSGMFGSPLRNVLYVLDEPSQGLHPDEVGKLLTFFSKIKNQGNTILVVDHNELLMSGADLIIDLGPGGGADGGRLVGCFDPTEAKKFSKVSPTAAAISEGQLYKAVKKRAVTESCQDLREFRNIRKFNLKIPMVHVALSGLTVVTGPSGAGKTTLLRCLHERLVDEAKDGQTLSFVGRQPPGKSSVSFPATYLGIFGHIRELYAQTTEAQVLGFDAAHFSLSRKGARCEDCSGRGSVVVSMKFLEDTEVLCTFCAGRRYKAAVNSILYKGLCLPDILDLTISEAAQFFSTNRRIMKILKPAVDIGLGYLKIGQPMKTLSGGEAQRLKLLPYLGKRDLASHYLLMDEPTQGLHRDDIGMLVNMFKDMVAKGATLIVVDNHPMVLSASDWGIAVGPGAADKGGTLVYEGSPLSV